MRLKFTEHFSPSDQFWLSPGNNVSTNDRFARSDDDKLFLVVKPGGRFGVDITVLPQVESIMAFPVILFTPKGKVCSIYSEGPHNPETCDSFSMTEVFPGTTGSIKDLITGPVGNRSYEPFEVIEGGPYGASLRAKGQSFSKLSIYSRAHKHANTQPIRTTEQYRRGLAYCPPKLASTIWIMSEQRRDEILAGYADHRPQQ